MPRKYRREKRRTAKALTWSDLDISAQLDFQVGAGPYGTLSECMKVWEQVRDEALKGHGDPFAEQIRRGVLAGEKPENVVAQLCREAEESDLRRLYQGLAEYGKIEGTEDEYVEDMTRSEAEGQETYRNSQLTQTEDI